MLGWDRIVDFKAKKATPPASPKEPTVMHTAIPANKTSLDFVGDGRHGSTITVRLGVERHSSLLRQEFTSDSVKLAGFDTDVANFHDSQTAI